MKQVFIKKEKRFEEQIDSMNEMFSGLLRDLNAANEVIAAQASKIAALENMVASLKKNLGI